MAASVEMTWFPPAPLLPSQRKMTEAVKRNRALRFSGFGLRLFSFWCLAAIISVAAWAWRPHQAAPLLAPTTATVGGLPQGAADVVSDPASSELSGFSLLLHQRLLGRDDSWTPMKLAQERLREHPGELLYAPIFEQGFKFQYPPTSLHLFDGLHAIFGSDALTSRVLNSISLGFLVLLAFATHQLAKPALAERRVALLDHALPFMFVASCYPLMKALALGQIQMYLNGLFALAALLYVRGHTASAGVIIGVMATIKPQMGLFLLWAPLQGEWRFTKALAICLTVLGGLALLRFGLAPHLEYLDVLSMISRRGESYFANQSINGLLLRALHLGPNLVFSSEDFAPFNPWVYYATLASSLMLIGLALIPRANTSGVESSTVTRGVHFGLAALCFTMASPVAWEHHYGVLPAIFASAVVALKARAPSRETVRLSWAVAIAWVLMCTRIGATGALADTPFNFLQSHLLFGALILVVALHSLCSPMVWPDWLGRAKRSRAAAA